VHGKFYFSQNLRRFKTIHVMHEFGMLITRFLWEKRHGLKILYTMQGRS